MPAEWSPHAATLMAWPLLADYWEGRADDARREWAGVARAVASSEPVIMVCNPGDEASVRDHCGDTVEVLPIPIDDSWMRDSGPIFVRDDAGEVAAVSFRFNAWGERFPSWVNDDAMPAAVAAHLGVRLFEAPFVLEGGSILVDGEGTLLTTEMCLLNPNRNPDLTKDEIERGLRDYLGVDTVVWLPYGMAGDVGPVATDGHVDGVAAYVAPGRVALLVPDDARDADHAFGRANLERLEASTDARGRSFEVESPDRSRREERLRELLPREPDRGRAPHRRRRGRARRRTAREALPRPRGDRRARRHDRVRRRRAALHHAAGARVSRTLERR